MTPRRRWAGALVLWVAAAWLLVLPAGPAAAAAQAGERVTDYAVTLTVDPDGGLAVQEVITYDFGTNARHGIFRDIPDRVTHDSRNDRLYPLSAFAVSASEGTPAQYRRERAGDATRLRIGDPDRTISGVHTYTIGYRVRGATEGFADHDELKWDAVGAKWEVPIERATVSVELPGPVKAVTCFAGREGSTNPCAASAVDGPRASFGAVGLAPFEGLTVVAAVDKGVLAPPALILEERWTIQRAFSATPATIGAGAGLLAVVVAAFARLAWRAGRDRRFAGSPVDVAFGSDTGADQRVPLMERAATPVELVPPDGIRPGQVGTLIDERANTLDVTATIVDLAVRGYLRIEEIPKKGWFGRGDWNLARLKGGDDLLPYERLLHQSLFQGKGDEVKLSELKNTFAARLANVQDALYADVVRQGWFRQRPDKVRARWVGIGLAMFSAGVALVVAAAIFTHLGLVPVGIVLGGLLVAVGSRWMPSRTPAGTGALRRVQGFRRFIEESEQERARFAERANLFSEYLPYAIVFGATEKWAKAFAGLEGQLPETGWYLGSQPFTAHSFASSMDGFTVVTAGTITSTPSGSGQSGFSSGGGFSGGGGGGGGGGSW